jgi:UDP-N-acetylmuramate dehydrogenase
VLLRENVSLARYTTFNIGGPARWFAEAETESDILETLAFAQARALPLLVLGGGSNVLVADAGFAGVVLHVSFRGIRQVDDTLEVAAGEEWDPVVAYAVAHNLAGLECLSGIPGLTGGTPVQNVGAYGQEVSQTITRVRAYDREVADFVELSNADCGFSYRTSIFNSSSRDRYIVTRVRFRLVHGGAPTLSYADLQRYFSGKAGAPNLAEVRDAVRSIRQMKGMLIVAGDPDSRSAGSFFRGACKVARRMAG